MLFYILFIISGILVDQLTKYLAIVFLSPVSTIPVIPHVFHLTYVPNTGAAFSILEGQQTFLIIMTSIFICALIYFFAIMPKTRKFFDINFALSMIISGAFGNLIDRIRLHYVVDFLDVRLIGFAIFNVADIFVVLGCALVIIALFRNKELMSDSPSPKKKRLFSKKKNIKTIKKTPDVQNGLYKDVLSKRIPKPKKKAQNLEPTIMTEIKVLPKHLETIDFEPTPPENDDDK